MRGAFRKLLILAAVVGCCVPSARAASEATLTGKVVDAGGKPLPGATVVLRNRDLAFREQGTVTDAKGEFRFPLLPPGPRYELTVSLPGFDSIVFSDLQLESNKTLVHDVALRPAGEFRETIRVEGKSQTLDTEKVTASTTFTSTFIAELPILGRDYQDILTLAPGVTDVNGTGNPNIHGARDTDVVTLVDGVSTTDPLTGYYGQSLNIESIQELEVITSAATAQYSRAQGGFANILTKSGGNEFQGTFKMFVRSDRLDGDGAGLEDPELIGGLQEEDELRGLHFTDLMPFLSLSGPLIRDRLWYYLTAEYIHEETPVHALNQAFVTPIYGYRNFVKATWQMHPSHRLAFSLAVDNERQENLGLSSVTAVESGYTSGRGGPTLTLRETGVFSPDALLESTLSWFDNRFSQVPTTDPDTNGNGILYVDGRPGLGGNGDGVLQASERDPGEDWDGDGRYDIFEDLNFNGIPLDSEDLDEDGWTRDIHSGCEGYDQEDLNCNGRIDSEADANLNGRWIQGKTQGSLMTVTASSATVRSRPRPARGAMVASIPRTATATGVSTSSGIRAIRRLPSGSTPMTTGSPSAASFAPRCRPTGSSAPTRKGAPPVLRCSTITITASGSPGGRMLRSSSPRPSAHTTSSSEVFTSTRDTMRTSFNAPASPCPREPSPPRQASRGARATGSGRARPWRSWAFPPSPTTRPPATTWGSTCTTPGGRFPTSPSAWGSGSIAKPCMPTGTDPSIPWPSATSSTPSCRPRGWTSTATTR
jgi:hypothetical protein